MNPGESAEPLPSPGDSEGHNGQSYHCGACARRFPLLSALARHMRCHAGARPYKCPYCQHRATQKGNLKVHIRSHKLGMLISTGAEEEGLGRGEGEGPGEVGVSEGMEGGASPTESGSACNGEVGGSEEGRGKVTGRSAKRDRPSVEARLFRCKLCGFETQREDQLLSHIEKVHIVADDEREEDEEEARTTENQETPAEVGAEEGQEFSCETCGQSFSQACPLAEHRKTHVAVVGHCCQVCGRTFREPWFLKSHMKTHAAPKSSARRRARFLPGQPPPTINDVAQDAELALARGAACLYELCAKCGHLFHDRRSLRTHSRVHARRKHASPARSPSNDEDHGPSAAKRCLTEYLGLWPAGGAGGGPEGGRRIPELDPVCSYQAWLLATKGRLVEPEGESRSDAKLAGRDETRVAAAVTLDPGSGRCGPEGQSKHRRGSHTSPGEWSPESPSDSEYHPSLGPERRQNSRSRARECHECGKLFRSQNLLTVHMRTHRHDGRGSGGDAVSPSGPVTPAASADPHGTKGSDSSTAPADQHTHTGVKPYVCSLCDFVTSESSSFFSHVRHTHPDPRTPALKAPPGTSPDPTLLPPSSPSSISPSLHPPSSSSVSPSIRSPSLSGFPQLKSALQHGPQPRTSSSTPPLPPLGTHPTPKRCPSDPASPYPDAEPPLDLCVRAGGPRGGAHAPSLMTEGLPSHRCSYCSHSTHYPELLWLHQTVTHRVNSAALAPKWAPRGRRGPRESAATFRRRTGPPPELEGKECGPPPSLVRSTRTRSPVVTKSGSPSPSSSGGTQWRAPPPGPAAPPSGRVRVPKAPAEAPRPRPGAELLPRARTSQGAQEKKRPSAGPRRPADSTKPGARSEERGGPVLREGLGLMLSGTRTPPHLPAPSGRKPHSGASSAGQHGCHGTSRPHGGATPGTPNTLKHEPSAETHSTPTDILSFLKSCSHQDLATLYQGWGAAGPQMGSTAVLRSLVRQGECVCQECGKAFSHSSLLRTDMRVHTAGFDMNGFRGCEAHTASPQASTQARDCSAAAGVRSESLRKGI